MSFRIVAVTALLILGGAPTAADATPLRFFGVVPQGPLRDADFDRMRGTVGTLRAPLLWADVEAEPGEYDFSAFDRLVSGAAAAGIQVLPFVYGTPAWMASDRGRPPLDDASQRAAWARFLRATVNRYGPRGRLWQGRRGRARPIRRWQVWNEPNFVIFWRPRPSAAAYARLLRISARSIRSIDPRARVITAGLAPIEGNPPPWDFLERLYGRPGVRAASDAIGLHPYAGSVYSLEYQIRSVRATMAAAGDGRTPLEVSELGVASEGRRASPMVKGLRGQAGFLRRAYGLLIENRRRWRLTGVAWFSWQDGVHDSSCVFCEHSGLIGPSGRPKPAWRALMGVVRRR